MPQDWKADVLSTNLSRRMQTTQGQPPQYTLPVVQPHLACSLQPNVMEGYKSTCVRRLAMTQIVLGCLAFGFQLWDIINMSTMSMIGIGIWSGVFFIITGSVGAYSANAKTVCSIVSFMVMSIISSLMAIGLLFVSACDLDYYIDCNSYNWYCRYMTDYMRICTIILSAMLIVISVAEGFIAVVAASLACHGCYYATRNQRVSPYTNAVQYVAGPNGQLLLMTGQQPNLVTTSTGQQVLIAANPAGYQAVGLPVQGNYQTPGIPAQPYMTTVPTMTTQQLMSQPGLVQPPAYQHTVGEQAAGTQQPQVHQSATNGKTNDAYVEN